MDTYCSQFIFKPDEKRTLEQAIAEAREKFKQHLSGDLRMGIWKLVAIVECEIQMTVTPVGN